MRRSYSLEEVAAAQLPDSWTDGVRWLARRLNRGELSGFRVGRVWRMTDGDVDFLIEKHRNLDRPAIVVPTLPPPSSGVVSFTDGLSARSRRRLAS
ncbi:MAG: DNA-binding protein [Mycobacterium sp.]